MNFIEEGEIYNERKLRELSNEQSADSISADSRNSGEGRRGSRENNDRTEQNGYEQNVNIGDGASDQTSLGQIEKGLESVNRYAPPLTIEEVTADSSLLQGSKGGIDLDKQHYIDVYNNYNDELRAEAKAQNIDFYVDGEFNEKASPEAVVGYYLSTYDNLQEANTVWNDNLAFAKETEPLTEAEAEEA